jgi:hypothetical protein
MKRPYSTKHYQYENFQGQLTNNKTENLKKVLTRQLFF